MNLLSSDGESIEDIQRIVGHHLFPFFSQICGVKEYKLLGMLDYLGRACNLPYMLDIRRPETVIFNPFSRPLSHVKYFSINNNRLYTI